MFVFHGPTAKQCHPGVGRGTSELGRQLGGTEHPVSSVTLPAHRHILCLSPGHLAVEGKSRVPWHRGSCLLFKKTSEFRGQVELLFFNVIYSHAKKFKIQIGISLTFSHSYLPGDANI